MKNICLVLVVIFFSYNTYTQDSKGSDTLFNLQKKKVKIDINTAVFTNVYQNMYVSKKPEALIVALFIPISYKEQRAQLNGKTLAKGMSFKGEKSINDEKVLWLSGIVTKKGIEFTKQKFYIRYNKNLSIELTTMLPVKACKDDKKMIEEIVNSVIALN